MSKLAKSLLVVSCAILIPGLIVAVALQILDMESYKQQLEQRASEASGMNVSVAGPMEISLFPRSHVTLNILHVEKEEQEIASASGIVVGFDIWPLFRRQLQINSVTLHDPVISIARLEDGTFNVRKPARYNGSLPTLDLDTISVRNATIRFADAISGTTYEGVGCNVEISDLALVDGTRAEVLQNLAIAAELGCDAIGSEAIVLNDVQLAIKGGEGEFTVEPITMSLFGGSGTGSIHADFTAESPAYNLEYSLPRFQTGTFLETFFPNQTITGDTAFMARLSMQGGTLDAVRQSLSGSFSLTGEALTVHGIDLDEELAEFESTQNFTLIDVGAVFFAGPLGLAVTKGYDYASLFQKSDSNSEITELVSDWTVSNGVAQAQDVAMTTSENLIALNGSLDLLNSRFNELTVALLDSRGCASVQQVIRGPFREPEIEKPGFLMALAGPALSLIKQGVEMLPGEECEPFYKGRLAPQ
jgi:uncharacterized protein involved in outer membrane biogenesis